MSALLLLLPLFSCVYSLPAGSTQGPAPAVDYASAASSISALIHSPTFSAYAKPKEKVQEWIALGDSYTAGTGCNGLDEIVGGGDAARGKRSYPMQMSTDRDGWDFVNGNGDPPRFSFSAYTGDTTIELVSQQLTQGDWKQTNPDLPRHPFGKPQLATVTIGGNDAKFGTILNDCIYRAWRPGNCDDTLKNLQKDLDDGTLREKINVALYHVADEGRKAGGATPRENFQVYVTSYMTFFNQDDPKCNDISWSYWGWSTPKLTTDLRKRFNDLTTQVNKAVQSAAEDLKSMGVIYVDGLEDVYKGHRFCEPDHTDQQMIGFDTWFWSQYSHQNTLSEGPGDPQNPYAAAAPDPQQAMLDFLFPGGNVKASTFSENSAPWDQPGLSAKYPDYDSLIKATSDDGNATIYAAPFNLLRSFHPKGTAHGHHKDLFMAAIADNRDHVDGAAVPGPSSTPTSPAPPVATDSCDVSYKFWYDSFEVRGKDFDAAKFGQDGSGLHDQIKGCGAITKWHFEQTPNDPRFTWFASGELPIGVKNCVGNAVKMAGGTSDGNCHGAG